jgi:hypothetical protein
MVFKRHQTKNQSCDDGMEVASCGVGLLNWVSGRKSRYPWIVAFWQNKISEKISGHHRRLSINFDVFGGKECLQK